MIARGAVDDKGQLMMFVEALRAWTQVGGGIPVPVSVLLEGEEEIGSPNLEPFLVANRETGAADFALISDTGMWNIDTPGITTRLRGMCNCEITVKGPSRDLHSGLFGGSALNPVNALVRILGDLHDERGRVHISGFYDAVREVTPEQQAQWQALGFDEDALLRGIGLSTPSGEHGVPALQRLWARPTADINGIWGGYSGSGSKTIIPSEASAKVSFRLVPNQDPHAIFEAFQRFVADRLPRGAQASYQAFGMSPRYRDRDRQAVGAGGARCPAAGVRAATGHDGQRWVHPRRRSDQACARYRLAADGLRTGRRPGSQPQRKVRDALLSPRQPIARTAFGQALGGGVNAS
jgi:acetylornithine deacetylase/succinyl-diaminopimelate desuccinylase-like protein